MYLSALDPALTFYQEEDWRDEQSYFYDRMTALALHRQMMRKYGQQIVMSDEMEALICERFPWGANYRNVQGLRDLRQFMLFEFGKAKVVAKTKNAEELSTGPERN